MKIEHSFLYNMDNWKVEILKQAVMCSGYSDYDGYKENDRGSQVYTVHSVQV